MQTFSELPARNVPNIQINFGTFFRQQNTHFELSKVPERSTVRGLQVA